MNQFYSAASKSSRCLFLPIILLFFSQGYAQPVISFVSKLTGLSSPLDIANAGDGTGRLFIVQQGGTIKVFDPATSAVGDFLTVSGITSGGERGLLSVAFHPAYASNGFFFVYYTNVNGDVEIARYHTAPGTPNTADPASKQVLLTIPHPGQSNHNGGKLNFGADGYLYFATGDGGGGGDIPNNAQDSTVLLGKMIRINVTTSATPPFYTIPPDNPYLVPGDNIRDEIWASGLRNPFRWSFDRQTHDMWIADVGQGAWEEVNHRVDGSTGGINYGWHCMEGTHTYPATDGCPLAPSLGNYAPPVLDYPHVDSSGGFAIIGGYVYRGAASPAMAGHYIFADEISNNVWLLPPGGAAADTIEFRNALANISSFGEAENGELYVVSLNGQLYNVVATANGALPVKLLHFDAVAAGNGTVLTWITADEQQFKQYEIEYSADAIHFQQAGVVAATGSGTYHFTHAISTTQKRYYRLKMVDKDGKFEYSKLVLVTGNDANAKNFVRPSVISNGVLNITVGDAFNSVDIINMNGKLVQHESIANRTGQIRIQLATVPAGQYLVRLAGNEKQLTQKVIVQ
jgi:glucose/arabinose dehydrogenase